MTTKPINKELLAEAHAILDGIPEDIIDLLVFQRSAGESLSCGTICCGGGWLALHPKFNALGLFLEIGFPRTKKNYGSYALEEIFDGDEDEVYEKVFDIRGEGTFDPEIFAKLGRGISDKTLLLHRIKIVYHGMDKWKASI